MLSVFVILVSSIVSISALKFTSTEENHLKSFIRWNIGFNDSYYNGLHDEYPHYAIELDNVRLGLSGSKLVKYTSEPNDTGRDRLFIAPIKFENGYVPEDFYDIDINLVGDGFPEKVSYFHWIGIGYKDEDFSKFADNPYIKHTPELNNIDIVNNHRLSNIDPSREAYLIISFRSYSFIDSMYTNVLYSLAGVGGTDIDKNVFLNGYNAGYKIGYAEGHKIGLSEGLSQNQNIVVWDNPIADVVNAVISAPFTFIGNLLNFELGGIVISGVVFTILTVVFVVWVLKFFL